MAEDMAIISLKNYDAALTAAKEKSGNSAAMTSAELASRIRSIPGEKPEQEKTVDITANGTTEVTPDAGKALSKVIARVAVPAGPTPETVDVNFFKDAAERIDVFYTTFDASTNTINYVVGVMAPEENWFTAPAIRSTIITIRDANNAYKLGSTPGCTLVGDTSLVIEDTYGGNTVAIGRKGGWTIIGVTPQAPLFVLSSSGNFIEIHGYTEIRSITEQLGTGSDGRLTFSRSEDQSGKFFSVNFVNREINGDCEIFAPARDWADFMVTTGPSTKSIRLKRSAIKVGGLCDAMILDTTQDVSINCMYEGTPMMTLAATNGENKE